MTWIRQNLGKSEGHSGPAWGKILAGALFIAALTAAWRYTPLSEFLTADRVNGWARAARQSTTAPLWVVLAYTPAAFIMFPRPVLTLLTVLAFGAWWGFAYSMIGIMVAALATYYAGWALPKNSLKKLAGDKLDNLSKKLSNHGFLAVLAIRIVPVAPFTVEGLVAGALRISVWDYMLGTFLGMVPGVLATAVFGRQIENAFSDTSTINYWIVGAVILACILFTVGVSRWLTKGARAS